MSMSNLKWETKDWRRCALQISMGRPVLILDQISAILAPSPNLPRVCRTPYLVPDRTRPRRLGMSSCGMPSPLSCSHTVLQ